MKKIGVSLCCCIISGLSLYFHLKIIEKPYSNENHGPFTPILEQSWTSNDPSQEVLQQLGILPTSIKVEPSFLEVKIGSSPTYIHTNFEATGTSAIVDYEIFAPHLHDLEKSSIDADGRLQISGHLQNETEFLVRARLRDDPEIFDDMIVIVR